MKGDFDGVLDQEAADADVTVLRMGERMDTADVALPASLSLLECDLADDVVVGDGDEGEGVVIVQIAAPVSAEAAGAQALLDEQALDFRHGSQKADEGGLVITAQRPDRARGAVLEHLHEGILVERVFEHGD